MKLAINHEGKDFIRQDWDNLILLDACRYDLFCEYSPFEMEPDMALSKGAESWEFMKANFKGRELHDTVYVTANPHTARLSSNTFHSIWNLLETHWDKESRTVHPDVVAEQALVAQSHFPHKRYFPTDVIGAIESPS